MRATLEPFVAEHGLEILGNAAQPFLTFLLRAQYEGPGFTGRLEDGRILACGGIIEDAPHSGNGWILPTALVRRYPLLFHKTVLSKWQELIQTMHIRRIQAMVDPRHAERIRWVERLGFVKEGVQRQGGMDHTDLWYYGWLRGNGNGS